MEWFQIAPGALMLWLGGYYVFCYVKKKAIVRKNTEIPVTVGHLLSGILCSIVGIIFMIVGATHGA